MSRDATLWSVSRSIEQSCADEKHGRRLKASFVIPTRNEESTIERCLLSVSKQIYTEYEIIVVDSSSDRTAEIAAKFGALVICQEPKGVAAALNAGIRHARGQIICLLGADDFIAPDYLEENLKPFTEGTVIGVCPLMEFVRPATLVGKVYHCYREIFYPPGRKVGGPWSWVPYLIRKDFFKEMRYDERLILGEDIDLWKRAEKVLETKGWTKRNGDGIYYFGDIEQTLREVFKKAMWYGLGSSKLLMRDAETALEFAFALFISFAPIYLISSALVEGIIPMIFATLYCISWPFIVLKAWYARGLTRHVLLIPLLLVWRAWGYMSGLALSLSPRTAERLIFSRDRSRSRS